MTATINASTSSGLIQTADTSGTLALQSNGTTQLTVSSTGAYGQLKSATAQASTSGTSIDFTSLPSWVKRITVMFSGVSTNGSSPYLIRLGDSGGIETTGYLCAAASISGASTATQNSTAGLIMQGGNGGAGESVHGEVFISLQNSSTNNWVSSGSLGRSDASGFYTSAGSKALSDTLTQIRITTVNGTDTFDAGSINILYEG